MNTSIRWFSYRTGRSSTQVTFSPRKERPLRIKVYSESEDAPVLTKTETPDKIDEVLHWELSRNAFNPFFEYTFFLYEIRVFLGSLDCS